MRQIVLVLGCGILLTAAGCDGLLFETFVGREARFAAAEQTVQESSAAFPVEVQLDLPSPNDVLVPFSLSGSASAGEDYTVGPSPLVVAAGETSARILITLVDDSLLESAETVVITLEPAERLRLGGLIVHTLIVADDDNLPALDVIDAVGSELTASVTFNVTLSVPSLLPVTVSYQTQSGTATSGVDFQAAGGTLTFAPGVTQQSVVVQITGDALLEGSETLALTLSNPVNATLARAVATGTLLDDETLPGIAIADTQAAEQSGAMTFSVSLSEATARTVSVAFASADNTATAGNDYTATSGTLTFAPGALTQTFSVILLDDGDLERSETFFADVTNPVNGSITRSRAVGTLLDDEVIPIVSIGDAVGPENITPLSFGVTLSEETGLTVTADYLTINGSAESSLDFEFAAAGLTFLPGEVSKVIAITILDDGLSEGTEEFSIDLDNPNGALPGTMTGIGAILDNDVVPDLSINDRAVSEDAGLVTFTVSLSEQTGTPVTLGWATADGIALAGADYVAASGNLTFDPGVTALFLTANIINDVVPEADETFFVNITSVQGANLIKSQGIATITDNDAAPVVEFDPGSPATVNEGDTALITVRLDRVSGANVTVPYTAANLTAESGDYSLSPVSPLTIPAGSVSADIQVSSIVDADPDDEQFTITLGTPTNATLGANRAHTLTLIDADRAPVLLSAETLDANLDGRIDHYRLTFSKPMDDSTFPGYNPAGNLGSPQGQWLVAGRTDAVLVLLAASPGGADVANDEVIYIRFTPLASPDTGATPEVTTTATPGLLATDGTALAQVTSGTVVEVDLATPLLLRASTESGLADLNVFFSEPVGPLTGCPGTLAATDFEYLDASGGGVTGVENGTDGEACTDAKLVLAAALGPFSAADVFNDRIRPVADSMYDLAGNAAPARFVTITAVVHPFVLNAASADLTLARLEYSEPMQAGPATTLGNYQVTTSGCAALSLIAVAEITSEIYEFTTSSQVQNCSYTLTVTGDVRDIDENTSLVDPKSATFLGREPLTVLSAKARSLRTAVITFSKDVLSGAGVGGAANLSYYTLSTALGAVQAAVRYDGVTGLTSDRNKVMVTHALDQGGAFYSIIVSTLLRDRVDTENLQPDPSDRTTFQGLGGSVTRLEEGALFIDPFGDGSTSSFTFVFAGKVHVGPNDTHSAVFRFDPDGQNPVTVTFSISTSAPSTVTSFANQVGSSGVDAFVAASVGGQSYLVFGVHKGTGPFTDLYVTRDTDNVLDIGYCDIRSVTLGNTESLQTIYGFGNSLYIGFGSNQARKPLFAALNLSVTGGACAALNDNIISVATNKAREISYLGGSGTPANPAASNGVDSIIAFDPGGTRLYIANNGGIASTASLPPTPTSTWTDVRHNGDGTWAGTTQQIPNIGRLRPGEKGVPVMTVWDGRLFVTRNRSDNNRAEIWKLTPPSTWTRVVNTASTLNGMNPNNTEATLITVNGARLYVGFDNETDGAEVWRTQEGITATTLNDHNDLERVAPSGFGPLGANDLNKNKYILSNASVFFSGQDYLYLTVGCNSDFTDNGACDRDPNIGQTDFAIRLFRQVD